MSVEKFRGSAGVTYTPTCDMCGDELPGCDSFPEAVQAMNDAGWIRRKNEHDEWENVCPDCQLEEDEL